MLKNLKSSKLVFSTIGILIIIVLLSLGMSQPISHMGLKNFSISVSNDSNYIVSTAPNQTGLKNETWDGLGMGMYTYWDPESMSNQLDILASSGFEYLRVDIPSYQDAEWLAKSKEGVIQAVAKGAKVIWGVSSNSYDNPAYTITANNWPDFRQAILEAAQWAQDNGVHEFQIGNEEEFHIDETTMTEAQIRANLRAVAKEVQQIFTNGKISYSCGQICIKDWAAEGKGDIDVLAANVYQGTTTFNDNWKTDIDNLVKSFGVSNVAITEFSLSSISLDSYSTDEVVQAQALAEMVAYIKASGVPRAFYFCWQTHEFGVRKSDGSFRNLWG